MNKNKYRLKSHMSELITEYIDQKRAWGYKYDETYVCRLRLLDKLFADDPEASMTRRKTYIKFIHKRNGEANNTIYRRACIWRQLAKFCRRVGIEAYIPETGDTPIARDEYCPYIYSRDEIAALFTAIEKLADLKRIAPRKPNLRLLLRLLYGAGLRLGEALKLTIGDYNSTDNCLRIVQGKGRKDRILPLSSGLRKSIQNHIDLFPGNYSTPLMRSHFKKSTAHMGDESARRAFVNHLLPMAGLPPRVNRTGPRLHDLRHTFAVHRLENWFLAGDDVEAKLPYLSVYMGHATLTETYYYLRITASFLPEISSRLSAQSLKIKSRGGRL